MTARSAHRRRFHPLLVLCMAYSLLAFAHSAATPVFEAPDEVWHYAYVRWVAEGNGLPPLTDDRSGANQEAAQPPFYYGLAALISRPFRDDDLPAVLYPNPGFGHQAPLTSADNKNMLIHPAEQVTRWRGAVLALHMTRATSWLFGLLAIWAAWGVGMEAFDRRRWALVTAALIAFQPQFVFISSVVNNDSAAAAIAGLVLWLGAVLLRRGTTWPRVLAAGLIGGLAALTKMSLLPAVPFLAACLTGSALLRARQGAGATVGGASDGGGARRGYGALHASYLAAFMLLVAAVGGWWYLRNLREAGDLLGLQHHTTTPWGRSGPAHLGTLLSELPLLFRSFWGAYGWGHVAWPTSVYVLLAVLTLPLLALALAVIARAWISALRGWQQHEGSRLEELMRGTPPDRSPLLVGTLSAIWLGGLTLALLRWMLLVEAPHGRLLFPALVAWALLLALGLREAHRWLAGRGAWALASSRVLLLLCAALTTLAPGARILATFALPRTQSPDRVVATCRQPQDLPYRLPSSPGDSLARLLCVESSPARVAPGDLVSVRACWTADRPMAEDYTVFVHLLGPDTSRVGERHTYPGLGRYPTSLWTPGRAFCDTYTLRVADWADVPTRYWVEIGLFDAATGDRLQAPADPAIVSTVTVTAGTGDTAPALPALATFGDAEKGPITLTARDVATHAAAGDLVPVTLHWSTSGAPSRDYVAFVHLWRPGDPAPLAQHDAQPRSGWYPTSLWHPGDVIPDTHSLALPADLAPGVYPLWAGLYDATEHTRVPAFAGGPLPYDLVPLGTLDVTAP